MTAPSPLEFIGFFTLVFVAAVGFVVTLICACYGAVILKRQWERGLKWEQTEQQVKEALEQ